MERDRNIGICLKTNLERREYGIYIVGNSYNDYFFYCDFDSIYNRIYL